MTVFFSGKATGSVRWAAAFDACDAEPTVVLLRPPPPGANTTGLGFGRIGNEVVGSLFDGPLSRMLFGPSICGRFGWRITFGLVGVTTPIGPPAGLWPVDPVPGLS